MPLNFAPVRFVRPEKDVSTTATDDDDSKNETFIEIGSHSQSEAAQPTSPVDRLTLSGEEAQAFYVSLFSSAELSLPSDYLESAPNFSQPCSDQNITQPVKKRKKNTMKSFKQESVDSLRKRYLRAASEGDLSEITKLLRQNPSILNCVDEFGWSALMCAAYEGKRDVVEFLLRQGVDYSLVNERNRTALNLARRRGHRKIVRLLSEVESGKLFHQFQESQSQVDGEFTTEFYCNICSATFSDPNHETSTIHLMKAESFVVGENYSEQSPAYLLPETNKGYQLMVRGGWNSRRGLGRDSQGRWYPVKTIFKRDRRCLGSANAPKPRVTHFAPHDVKAIEKRKSLDRKVILKSENLGKKERQKREAEEREWIKEFRREFY